MAGAHPLGYWCAHWIDLMKTIRKANDRGRTEWDWLDSRHTFSFGEYLDSEHMGFRSLRVINDDN